jgi:hypothetical protein
MTFEHPLARTAKIGSTAGAAGKPKRRLVIVTALDLDRSSATFKADKVALLATAAKQWMEANPAQVADLLPMNRPKTWIGERD